MKITVNYSGNLLVNNKEKYCPYQKGDVNCGDWCALFMEPGIGRDRFHGGSDVERLLVPTVFIELCKVRWYCPAEDFTDEREKSKEGENARNS